MSFHNKSALAHFCTLALMGGGWFAYMPWAISSGFLLPQLAFVGAGLLFLGNGLLYVYLRTLRCPNCLIRFGPKMYRPGLIHLPWPRKDCWNCGVDLGEAEKVTHAQPPSKKPAPAPHELPLRWRAVLALVVVWNAFGLASLFVSPEISADPTSVMALELAFLLGVSWGTKHLHRMQQFIISDGHDVDQIKRFLTFMQAFAIVGLVALALSATVKTLTG
jgi:hypothetical protein